MDRSPGSRGGQEGNVFADVCDGRDGEKVGREQRSGHLEEGGEGHGERSYLRGIDGES